MTDVDRHLSAWLERPENSARSVLVTIFGDVVRPVTNSLWLAQLFELCGPFGFSTRLIRTSLFRLASDGWVESERVGRRSRYSLSTLALRESEVADRRIYANVDPSWDGTWTILLVDPDNADGKRFDRLVQHLRWRGFWPIDRRILVAPNVSGVGARELLDLLEPTTVAAVGEARFDDVRALIARGAFADPLNRRAIEDACGDFVATYERFTHVSVGEMSSCRAYALRVALVHDLRRIVLRSPPPPRELLPTPWAGDRAFAVAARLYPALCEHSAAWLSSVFDIEYPRRFVERFSLA